MKQETRATRTIRIISAILLIFIAYLIAQLALSIYNMQFKDTWSIISPLTAAISAILVTQTAGRSIQVTERQRLEDRTLERLSKLHYLIAITKCLEGRLGYIFNILTDKRKRPLLALPMAVNEATVHYEKLYDKDNFYLLPRETAEVLISMDGTIFGANLLKETTASDEGSELQTEVPKYSLTEPMIVNLQEAIDGVRRIRRELEQLRDAG